MCSFWLICVYSVFTKLYGTGLSLISSLMKLFRGAKYNIIRKRDDSNTYEVTELYIGVMVFSISIFLIPTIAVFYFYCFI